MYVVIVKDTDKNVGKVDFEVKQVMGAKIAKYIYLYLFLCREQVKSAFML